MALPTTVVLNRARQQYRNSHRGASNVHYEDEYEKLNDSLRIKWGNLMDESGRYKTSSFYKKVKCLLISWHEDCDDLKTEEEVIAKCPTTDETVAN